MGDLKKQSFRSSSTNGVITEIRAETELIGKLLNTLNSLGKKVVIEGFIKNANSLEEA